MQHRTQPSTQNIISALWCAVVAGALCATIVAPASAQPVTAAKSTHPASTLPATTVVGTVDNDKILMSSVSVILDQIKARAPQVPQADLDGMRYQIVEDLIDERVLVNEAKRLKLIPPEEKIDDALWKLKQPFSSPKAFTESLKTQGKTEADLRTVIAEDMMITNLSKQITKDVVVSDAEIAAFYNEHKIEFLVPEMVHVRHIQLSFPGEIDKEGNLVMKTMTEASKKTMRQKAEALLKKASAANADFAALAKANSEDKVSKPAGGDLGFLAQDDVMDAAFRAAAFAAPVGKVYPKVVETKFGYNILKVDDKKASRTMALTEVSAAIKSRLLQQKFKLRMDAKVVELRKNAKITNIFPKSTA